MILQKELNHHLVISSAIPFNVNAFQSHMERPFREDPAYFSVNFMSLLLCVSVFVRGKADVWKLKRNYCNFGGVTDSVS